MQRNGVVISSLHPPHVRSRDARTLHKYSYSRVGNNIVDVPNYM